MKDPERLDLPSASSFAQDCACAGRRQIIEQIPDDFQMPADEEADRGTRIHKAFETGDPSELDEEDLELYNRGVRNEAVLLSEWTQQFGISKFDEMVREQRMFINHPATLKPLASARLDRHFIGKDATGHTRVLINELKTLWCSNLPPAEKAWQGRLQVVLVAEEYQAGHVRFCFNKPMLRQTDVCDYGPDDIESCMAAILYHIWMSEQPDAQRSPGLHCRYCPCAAAAICPEAAAYSLLPSVIATRAGLPPQLTSTRAGLPPQLTSKQDIETAVARLQPADLVRVWQAANVVNKIQEAVKARLKSFSDEDLAALGLGRGKAKKLRTVEKVMEAFAFLRDHLQCTEPEIFSAMGFSNDGLTDIFRYKHGLKKDQARAFMLEQLKDFIDEKESDRALEKIE